MKNKTNEVLYTEQSKESKSLVEEIIKEINSARYNPEKYLTKVNNWKKQIKPKFNILHINDKQIVINDIEQCFEELIQYLCFVKSMPKFKPYEPLFNSTDEIMNIITAHPYNEELLSKNIPDLEKRLKKNGIVYGVIAECIEYGLDDAEAIVLKLLLDEKNDKMDRSILFNSYLRNIGVSCFVLNSEVTITLLNFSENQILKKDKLIINLNKKLVYERLGKKNDSAKDYIYKMKLHNSTNQIKRKYSQSISSNSSNSLLKSFISQTPSNNSNNCQLKELLSKENGIRNSTKQLNIPALSKSTVKTSESLNNSLSNLKDLKISTETLEKAPNILKRLISPNQGDTNFKMNTKVVNINLVEDDKLDNKREETPTSSHKGSRLTSPIKTIRGSEERSNKRINGANTTLSSINLNNINLTKQKTSSICDVSTTNIDDNLSDKVSLKNLKYYNNAEPTKKSLNNNTKIGNRNSNNISVLSNNKSNLTNYSSASSNLRKKSGSTQKEAINNSMNIKFDDKNDFEKEIVNYNNIMCINVNKRKVVDKKGNESFIIKKTVYYDNGTTDEWIFKE